MQNQDRRTLQAELDDVTAQAGQAGGPPPRSWPPRSRPAASKAQFATVFADRAQAVHERTRPPSTACSGCAPCRWPAPGRRRRRGRRRPRCCRPPRRRIGSPPRAACLARRTGATPQCVARWPRLAGHARLPGVSMDHHRRASGRSGRWRRRSSWCAASTSLAADPPTRPECRPDHPSGVCRPRPAWPHPGSRCSHPRRRWC